MRFCLHLIEFALLDSDAEISHKKGLSVHVDYSQDLFTYWL